MAQTLPVAETVTTLNQVGDLFNLNRTNELYEVLRVLKQIGELVAQR